eukprot:7238815-Pyramimonas_sp.AAC.1
MEEGGGGHEKLYWVCGTHAGGPTGIFVQLCVGLARREPMFKRPRKPENVALSGKGASEPKPLSQPPVGEPAPSAVPPSAAARF